MAGRMTSLGLVAALWKHGPDMMDRMRRQQIAWPTSKAPKWRTFPPTLADTSSNDGHPLNLNAPIARNGPHPNCATAHHLQLRCLSAYTSSACPRKPTVSSSETGRRIPS